MGNSSSKNSNKSAKKEFDNFYTMIDYVATNYILTMDFKSLTKLSEKEYCDKLVVLSSDIINKNFTDLEVTYLLDRVENGDQTSQATTATTEGPVAPRESPITPTPSRSVVPATPEYPPPSLSESNLVTPARLLTPQERAATSYWQDRSGQTTGSEEEEKKPLPNTKTGNLLFVDKTELDNLSKDKKKYKCIGIAKYYVKIAHVFAAIVTTISPVFRYKDSSTGKMVETGFLDKDKIPRNVPRKLYKLNICDNRINSLKRGHKYVKAGDKNAVIYPKICSFNYTKNGILKTLRDEPGIKELSQLYYDDNYNYTDGTFEGMSTETESQYYSDLQVFYTAFTGEKDMPPSIKNFGDIKLRDYNTKPGCQLQSGEKTPIYNKIYQLSRDDELFKQYGNNIQNMIQSAADKQQELLSVIDKLFFIEPGEENIGKVRIHPKLTDLILREVVLKTRKIIMELYVKCENDYVSGLKIYEAIVESKIRKTTQNQIITLQKEATKTINDTMKLTTSTESSRTRSSIQSPKNETNIENPTLSSPYTSSLPPVPSTTPSVKGQEDMFLSTIPKKTEEATGSGDI